MPTPLPYVDVCAHGIQVIDTGFHRPKFDASYLIIEEGRAAFVDTGTNHSVERLLAALKASDLDVDAVDHVIATHVHLDHAGGVGLLMQHLPRATLVVHPRGAKHMIDPAALVQGATAVYGPEEVGRSYGTIIGVPVERVLQTTDGMTLELAGRELLFLDTPGHAMHHHCVWDVRSQGFFTGDTFGLSYREFDSARGPWAMPTTTPVQFQPEAMRHSIERLLSFKPAVMYLTHYGPIGDVPRIGALLLSQLDAMVALATSLAKTMPAGDSRKAALERGLFEIHWQSLQAHGAPVERAAAMALLSLDLDLNAQGIEIWLARTQA